MGMLLIRITTTALSQIVQIIHTRLVMKSPLNQLTYRLTNPLLFRISKRYSFS